MKSVRWLITAVVAGLLALTGCSTPGANVAASVNGTAIPVASLDQQVAAIRNQTAPTSDINAAVLTVAIQAQVARTIAVENRIDLGPVTRAQALQSNAQLAQFAQLAANPAAQPFVDGLIDTNVVVTRIGGPAFLARVAQTNVQVNPRYGSWSVADASVTKDGGQLSEPWFAPGTPA